MTKQEQVEQLAKDLNTINSLQIINIYTPFYQEALCLYDLGYRKQKEIVKEFENGTLSERKICKNVTKQHPVDEFICSECGLILEGLSLIHI